MKFGIGIPTCREGVFYPAPFADANDIAETALLAEKLGFDSVWGTDWITPTPRRNIPDKEPPNWYDLLISLAYCAAITNRITLAAGTIVLPFRETVILAKQISTLDQFSNGRFLLGVGLGGNREEFEFIRPKDKPAHRGRLFEEQLEALSLLLSGEKVSHRGEYVEFNDVILNPTPANQIPIYFSGNSPNLPQRVAKWGSGLLTPVAPGRIAQRVDALKAALVGLDRDISEIDVAGHAYVSIARSKESALEKFRKSQVGRRYQGRSVEAMLSDNFIGTPSDIAEHIMRLAREGMTHCLATNYAVDIFAEMKEQVQIFAKEVVPLCQ